MRTSTILLAALSALATSVSAICGDLDASAIAILAACGNTAELTSCLTPSDKCIKKCLLTAGCSDAEAKSFAKWFHNDCKETRTFEDLSSNLRKRQEKKPADNKANEEEDAEEGENAEEESAPADTKAADPATAAETKAADPGTEAAKTPAATAAETEAPAETKATAFVPPPLSTSEPETATPATEEAPVTSFQPQETIVATVTDKSGKTIVTTAAASIATLAKPLVCLTTRFVDAESCTKEKGAATSVCVPTKTPEIGCGPGLLCQMTEKGNQICMKKENTPILSGIIVIVCLTLFLSGMIGTVIFMSCKTKKEQEREKKQKEALAIANGMKPPGSGGAAATDAYVPLMGARGTTRDSSANPFGGGSGRNSRRPSTLGTGATSPGGYGGMNESRSPIDSRAPSPLGMPGSSEDLSYGGGRRI